jgi:hypothetical protein
MRDVSTILRIPIQRDLRRSPLTGRRPCEETVQATLAERGLHVPTALFDYYAVAGFYWINAKYNQLRPIDELGWYEDWLVFMDDDQGLVSWGGHKQDLNSSDPVVWQGIVSEEIDWF